MIWKRCQHTRSPTWGWYDSDAEFEKFTNNTKCQSCLGDHKSLLQHCSIWKKYGKKDVRTIVPLTISLSKNIAKLPTWDAKEKIHFSDRLPKASRDPIVTLWMKQKWYFLFPSVSKIQHTEDIFMKGIECKLRQTWNCLCFKPNYMN